LRDLKKTKVLFGVDRELVTEDNAVALHITENNAVALHVTENNAVALHITKQVSFTHGNLLFRFLFLIEQLAFCSFSARYVWM
jgi:hypothetical protein